MFPLGPYCGIFSAGTEKAIAITGATPLFELVRDCVARLRATDDGRALALGSSNCVLTYEQRALFRGAVERSSSCGRYFDFPEPRQAQVWLQGADARPFLPRYFPGLRSYLWIECRLLGGSSACDRGSSHCGRTCALAGGLPDTISRCSTIITPWDCNSSTYHGCVLRLCHSSLKLPPFVSAFR